MHKETNKGETDKSKSGKINQGNLTQWFHYLLVAAMLVGSALCWSSAPEQIPIHWNIQGEVDGFGGKLPSLLFLPVVAIGLHILLGFLPTIDPGAANCEQFKRTFRTIRLLPTVIFFVIHSVLLAHAIGHHPDMSLIVGCAFGLVMIVIGNCLGKVRPNWFVGIRTPWTLSSKLAWTKTHRIGGWLFVVLGVGILIAAVVNSAWAIPIGLVSVVASSLGLVVYSWCVWRSDPDRIHPVGTSPVSGEK